MKHLLFGSVLLVILFSCKKEVTEDFNNTMLLNSIQVQLKDSISSNDFEQLDFTNSVFSKLAINEMNLIRIPFKNKSISTDFVLLKIEKNKLFSSGKIIHLSQYKIGLISTSKQFNGEINISTLNRKSSHISTIKNGYLESLPHPVKNPSAKLDIVIVPLLPEVVLISSYPPAGGGISVSTWYNLVSMLDGSGTSSAGGIGGYYSYSGLLSTTTASTGGGGASMQDVSQPIYIDYEPAETLPAIDIKKYLKCFSSIPDAGAICSIKILTDIPVDRDPGAFFDWENGSPGHTFLQIKKINGNQIVQQNIGFYPVTGWKNTLTTAPSDGKLVDNFSHEFNASLNMNLTPEKFQQIITHIEYLSNFIRYDIDEYNCTDFALDVFNYARGGNQLTIPKYDIPGGAAPFGTNTPQGLYQKLNAMKALGNAESKDIIIPGLKGFVGSSNGPCN